MKRLNKWQSAIFAISAVIMVVGVLAGLWKSAFFPHIYAVGAVGYVCIQLLQRYSVAADCCTDVCRTGLLSWP